MAGNAWVITMYTDESDGTIDYVVGGGTKNFLPASSTTPNPNYPALDVSGAPITDPTNPAYEPQYMSKLNPAYDGGTSGTINRWLPLDATDIATAFNSANIYLDATTTTPTVRDIQGSYQQLYTDRDVRMERVTINVTFPAV